MFYVVVEVYVCIFLLNSKSFDSITFDSITALLCCSVFGLLLKITWLFAQTVGGMMKVWVSFQPPSHLLERRTLYSILVGGGKSGIYRGDMEHVS